MRGLESLSSAALTIGIAVMIIAFVALVMSNVQTEVGAQAGNASVAYNATTKGLTGLSTFATWVPIVALVIVAVIVIGLLLGGFGGIVGGRPGAGV